MKDFMQRFRSFLPLVLMSFIEGEPAGGGGGESATERAVAYLNENEPAADPAAQPGAAVIEPAAGKPAAGEPDPAAVAAAAAALKPGEVGAQPGAQPGQPPAPPAQPAFDPKNWHAAEPVAKFFTETLGPYAVGQDGKPLGQDQLRLVMDDARALYEIADGKRTPEALLTIFKNDYPKAFEKFVDTAIAMSGKKIEGAAPKDPALERVEKLEQGLKEQREAEEQARVQQTRQKAHDGFLQQVTTNLEKNFPWIKEADPKTRAFAQNLYALVTSSMINGNRDITGRFEAGNYADADRLFTEVHNGIIGLLQGWSKALVAAKTAAASGNPRIPAHGAPPAPAGTPRKFNPSSYEERTAAASEYLDNA